MMTGGGNMPRSIPNPSIRILAKGRLCARVAILVALGTLLLAGRAHAAAPVAEPAGEASSSTPAEPAPEASSSTTPAAEPAPEASSPAEPVVGSSPEASSPSLATETSAGETSSPASGAEPAGEASSSTSAESIAEPAPVASSPAPVADPAPEVSSPTGPVVEPAPKASPPVESSKEATEAPVVEPKKEAAEVPAGKPVLEKGAENLSQTLSSASQSATTAGNPSDSVAAEVSGTATGPLTAILPVTEELPATSTASSVSVAALALTIAAQRAENFTRELGGLGASSTDTYAAGLDTAGIDSPSLISAAFVEDLATGTAARAGAPAPGRSGGPPGGGSPIGPPPGSTPSGTFSAAAGGGSGTALSGFPTFAGHLLRGAPLAMRRLRLSFQPWLTAFFVLIPERPG
jgi:hypothetical protein